MCSRMFKKEDRQDSDKTLYDEIYIILIDITAKISSEWKVMKRIETPHKNLSRELKKNKTS